MAQTKLKLDRKNILVVGLARSGTAAARLAHALGARVTVTDTRPEKELGNNLDRLSSAVNVNLGSPSEKDCLEADLIVLSPGVPPEQDWIKKAVSAGIRIISEVELAYTQMDGQVLGITGTNGKTTTTLLTGEILTASGIDNEVAGNIGTALSEAVLMAAEANRKPIFVTELSSFQLERIQEFTCGIAVFLNCTPDHLDRYPNFEAYRKAKLRVFRNQTENDFAVINGDDPFLMEEAEKLPSQVFPFSLSKSLEQGVFTDKGYVWACWNGRKHRLIRTADIKLRGNHNLENTAAALAASFLAGADTETLPGTIRNFKGPEHRLEFVARVDGVDYFNDSKSTTAQSTMKALHSFSGDIVLIMGGYDKKEDFSLLQEAVTAKVSHLILMGDTAEKIEKQLGGSADIFRVGNLDKALNTAAGLAGPGTTVLLSPACASFDMFTDFEHRGKKFKSLVLNIKSHDSQSVSEVNSA